MSSDAISVSVRCVLLLSPDPVDMATLRLSTSWKTHTHSVQMMSLMLYHHYRKIISSLLLNQRISLWFQVKDLYCFRRVF